MLLPLPTPFAAALGQRVESARSRLLWDADFRTMPRQPLPATLAALRAQLAGGYALASTAPAASNLWVLDQAGAGVATDAIGAKTLTPSGTPLQGQRVVGLHKGGAAGARWHLAAEFGDAGAAYLDAASAADFNPGAVSSWGLHLVLRHGRKPSATRTIVSKQGAAGAGWRLVRTATGDYNFIATDGANTATLVIAAPTRDNAPHHLFVRINRTATQLQGFTDLGAVTSVALGAVGNVTSAVTMRVGAGGAGHLVTTSAHAQVAYLAVYTGAAAEAFSSTHTSNFWRHAATPAGVTYVRNGALVTELEDDATLGVQCSGWKANQVAWERHVGLEGLGLGAAAYPQIANLLASSELTAWTAVTGTLTADTATAPTGMKEAGRWSASGGANQLRSSANLTNTRTARPSIYARALVDTVTVYVEIYDVTYTTLKVSQATTVGTAWQRCVIGGGWTVDATATFGIVVRVDGAADKAYLWGPQVTEGAHDAPLAFSDGAAATCPKIDIQVTGAAAAILRGEEGTLVADYACAEAAASADRFVVDVSNAASNNNRRLIKVASGGDTSGVYSSAGADLGGPVVGAALQTLLQNRRKHAELAWAANRVLEAPIDRATLTVDDVEVSGATTGSPFAYSDTVTTAWLGQDQAGANQLGGTLRRVRCYGAA